MAVGESPPTTHPRRVPSRFPRALCSGLQIVPAVREALSQRTPQLHMAPRCRIRPLRRVFVCLLSVVCCWSKINSTASLPSRSHSSHSCPMTPQTHTHTHTLPRGFPPPGFLAATLRLIDPSTGYILTYYYYVSLSLSLLRPARPGTSPTSVAGPLSSAPGRHVGVLSLVPSG